MKNRKIISLFILAAMSLASCRSTSVSTAKPSPSTTPSTQPSVPSTKPSTPSTKPSTPDEPVLSTQEKALENLKKGFYAEEIIKTSEKWGTDEPTLKVSLFDFSQTEKCYQYRQYLGVENNGTYTRGSVEYGGSFMSITDSDGKDYVNLFELNLDNQVHYTQLLDSLDDTPLLWSDYGFDNAFYFLDAEQIKKNDDNGKYYFDFPSCSNEFIDNLSIQLYGMEFATIKSFEFTIVNDKIDTYSVVYKTKEETVMGQPVATDITIEGKVITSGTEDVIKGNKPLTGTEDVKLKAAFDSLKAGNFRYEYTKYQDTFPSTGVMTKYNSAAAMCKEDQMTLTTYLKNGSVNFDGGYYTPTDGKTQEVTHINDKFYKNGTMKDYPVHGGILPTFDNISPLFFDKVSEGKYVLNQDKYYTGQDAANSVCSVLSTSIINGLTIELKEDGAIEFTNYIEQGAHTAAEKTVDCYSLIGNVKDAPLPYSSIKSSIKGLKWSEIFQKSQYIDGVKTYLGDGVIDMIPTTEDNHSKFLLYFDEDMGDLEFQYQTPTLEEAQAMVYRYDLIMKKAGFSDPVIDKKYGDHTYTKTLDNGKTLEVTASGSQSIGDYFFFLIPAVLD